MDIVEKSNAILRRIEQNDPKLTSLYIGPDDSQFWLHEGADLLRLGHAIANNTHLESIDLRESSPLLVDNTVPLIEGLQQNTTIKDVRNAILSEYVGNNSSLTRIDIILHSNLRGGIAGFLAPAIKKCQNLKVINIVCRFIDDEIVQIIQIQMIVLLQITIVLKNRPKMRRY